MSEWCWSWWQARTDIESTDSHFARFAPHFPLASGHTEVPQRQVLNAWLYVAKEGSTWHGLPARFGNWNAVYVMNIRWAKRGVLERVW